MKSGMRSRILIGVVGGGEQPDLAAHIGCELVKQKAIALTGGDLNRPASSEVKDVVLQAADGYSRQTGEIGRLVGILPIEDGQKPVRWRGDRAGTVRSLFVQTTLTSWERDVINGATPDVLIALRGGRGTLAEIGFAALTGVPIIFADSSAFLNTKLNSHREKFLSTIIPHITLKYESVNGIPIEGNSYVKKLGDSLRDPSASMLFNPALQTAAQFATSVVQGAVARVTGSILKQSFPGIPGETGSIERFYEELQNLE